MREVKTIYETVVALKHDLFPESFEKIFISHREKDQKQIVAFMELLYALGIPRPTATQPESVIFCTSHPATYLENGSRNLDEIKKQFTDSAHRSIRKEGSHSTRSERPNLWFALPAPDGTEVYPYKPDGTEGCWRWSMETYIENQKQGIVEWVKTENGWQAYAKQYLDTDAAKPPETLWLHQEVGHNHSAAENLKKLLSGKVFDSPKPVELITKMLKLATYTDTGDIILDFFSGSATTAHAVMQLNAEDGGNRQFIMVQLPEVCDEKSEAAKNGYPNICEIGKERIRRAGQKLIETGKDIDTGFKVFRLDSSNLKLWDDTPIESGDLDSLFARMNGIIDNLKPGRSEDDLVYEILLKMGYPLTADVAALEVDGLTVYTVEQNSMLICLQPGVTAETVEKLAVLGPKKIVLIENALADNSAMSNAHYLLENRGIELKIV